MTEIRKKLTETQFRLLINAQLKYDRAVTVAQTAGSELNTVRELVLDSLELDNEVDSWIDASTQELVINEEKEPEDD